MIEDDNELTAENVSWGSKEVSVISVLLLQFKVMDTRTREVHFDKL